MKPPIRLPESRGLYDPANEHDSCGVGFIAHIKGKRSRQIVDDADRMLQHMEHRGGCGCEDNTGDGAGMLTALPYELIEKIAKEELGQELPKRGLYGSGVFFMPTDPAERARCREIVDRIIIELLTNCILRDNFEIVHGCFVILLGFCFDGSQHTIRRLRCRHCIWAKVCTRNDSSFRWN